MTTLGKNLQPLDLRGVNPIVAMPFTQHGEVDYKSFTNLLEHLASTNCQGLTLFGIASEFYKLEEEEKKRLNTRCCSAERLCRIIHDGYAYGRRRGCYARLFFYRDLC